QTATVVVNPGPAATIAANSPTSQTAAAGTAVSSPPSVIVKDANGNPVAGVSVTFSPAVGSGTVTGGSQMTNASGVATVGSWTLSATAGSNTLTATSGSLSGSPVTFTAAGTAGPSATMARSSGDNLTGQVATRLQTPHVVLVSDANGNPVAGVTVAWAAGSGGGSVHESRGGRPGDGDTGNGERVGQSHDVDEQRQWHRDDHLDARHDGGDADGAGDGCRIARDLQRDGHGRSGRDACGEQCDEPVGRGGDRRQLTALDAREGCQQESRDRGGGDVRGGAGERDDHRWEPDHER